MFPFTRDLPRTIAVALATLFFVEAATAQQRLPTPWASPASTVSQVIGITDVTVTFGRPAVKGRTIWGGLVPYEDVWRAGANDNTTITFANDVKVDGQPLPAGTYGLHMIPHKDTWTIIFSHNSTSWGSFSYDQKEDALRVDVTPVATSPPTTPRCGCAGRSWPCRCRSRWTPPPWCWTTRATSTCAASRASRGMAGTAPRATAS
jgi:hypothetical protein